VYQCDAIPTQNHSAGVGSTPTKRRHQPPQQEQKNAPALKPTRPNATMTQKPTLKNPSPSNEYSPFLFTGF